MKGIRKILIISFVIFGINLSELHAQIEILKELEIEIPAGERSFHFISLESEGFLLFRKSINEPSEDLIHWEILYYDAEMNLKSSNFIQTEFMYSVIGYAYENGIVYLLFSGVKNLKKRLFIHRVESESSISEKIEIDSFFPDVLTYFSVFNNSIIIGGRERAKPSIVFYDQNEGRTIILQGLYEKRMNVYDVEIDKTNKIFSVIIGYKNNARQACLNIRSFDEFGSPIENIRLEPDPGLDFIYGKGMIANNNLRIVSGIYSELNSNIPVGIFLSSHTLNGETETKYYPMEELMTEIDSLQQLQKYSRMRFRSNYIAADQPHWYVTEMNEYNNDNILVAESFSIEKSGNSISGVDKLIYYDNAIVLGFDDNLSLKWMNTMDLKPVCSEEVKKNIKVVCYPDSLKLFFFNKTSLAEKMINGNENLAPRYLKPLLPDQIAREDFYNCIDQPFSFGRWYEDNYYLTGSKQDPETVDQDIFFVYKIQYR